MIEDIKKTQRATADKLRANMDAAKYIISANHQIALPFASLRDLLPPRLNSSQRLLQEAESENKKAVA